MNFRVLKSITWVLIFSMAFEQFAYADVIKPLKLGLFDSHKISLHLPPAMGVLEDVHRAEGGDLKRIYLLKEAHTNESAEHNIAGILDQILRQDKTVKTFYVEAAAGNVSLSDLRPLGKESSRRRVAEAYIRKGLFHGAELLDLTTDRFFGLIGVEDPELYQKALSSYRAVAENRSKYLDYLKRIDVTAGYLKTRLWNPSLIAFEESVRKSKKEEMSFTDYLDLLRKTANAQSVDLSGYPSLALLSQLREKESQIDFVLAQSEEKKAVASLPLEDQQRLKDWTKNLKAPGKVLISTHEEEARGFFALLKEKLATSIQNYPELSKYFDYLDLYEKLDSKQALQEIDTLQAALFEVLARTEDEKQLLRACQALEALRELFQLTLLPERYQQYKEDSRNYGIKELTGFLNLKLMELKGDPARALFLEEGYDKIAAQAENFYALTADRDEAFVRNMLSQMSTKGEKSAALIAGGYHAENLKAILRSQGVSYAEISPRVYHETNLKKYEKVLLGAGLFKPVMAAKPAMMGVPYAAVNVMPGGGTVKDAVAGELGARLALPRQGFGGQAGTELKANSLKNFLSQFIEFFYRHFGVTDDPAKRPAIDLPMIGNNENDARLGVLQLYMTSFLRYLDKAFSFESRDNFSAGEEGRFRHATGRVSAPGVFWSFLTLWGKGLERAEWLPGYFLKLGFSSFPANGTQEEWVRTHRNSRLDLFPAIFSAASFSPSQQKYTTSLPEVSTLSAKSGPALRSPKGVEGLPSKARSATEGARLAGINSTNLSSDTQIKMASEVSEQLKQYAMHAGRKGKTVHVRGVSRQEVEVWKRLMAAESMHSGYDYYNFIRTVSTRFDHTIKEEKSEELMRQLRNVQAFLAENYSVRSLHSWVDSAQNFWIDVSGARLADSASPMDRTKKHVMQDLRIRLFSQDDIRLIISGLDAAFRKYNLNFLSEEQVAGIYKDISALFFRPTFIGLAQFSIINFMFKWFFPSYQPHFQANAVYVKSVYRAEIIGVAEKYLRQLVRDLKPPVLTAEQVTQIRSLVAASKSPNLAGVIISLGQNDGKSMSDEPEWKVLFVLNQVDDFTIDEVTFAELSRLASELQDLGFIGDIPTAPVDLSKDIEDMTVFMYLIPLAKQGGIVFVGDARQPLFPDWRVIARSPDEDNSLQSRIEQKIAMSLETVKTSRFGARLAESGITRRGFLGLLAAAPVAVSAQLFRPLPERLKFSDGVFEKKDPPTEPISGAWATVTLMDNIYTRPRDRFIFKFEEMVGNDAPYKNRVYFVLYFDSSGNSSQATAMADETGVMRVAVPRDSYTKSIKVFSADENFARQAKLKIVSIEIERNTPEEYRTVEVNSPNTGARLAGADQSVEEMLVREHLWMELVTAWRKGLLKKFPERSRVETSNFEPDEAVIIANIRHSMDYEKIPPHLSAWDAKFLEKMAFRFTFVSPGEILIHTRSGSKPIEVSNLVEIRYLENPHKTATGSDDLLRVITKTERFHLFADGRKQDIPQKKEAPWWLPDIYGDLFKGRVAGARLAGTPIQDKAALRHVLDRIIEIEKRLRTINSKQIKTHDFAGHNKWDDVDHYVIKALKRLVNEKVTLEALLEGKFSVSEAIHDDVTTAFLLESMFILSEAAHKAAKLKDEEKLLQQIEMVRRELYSLFKSEMARNLHTFLEELSVIADDLELVTRRVDSNEHALHLGALARRIRNMKSYDFDQLIDIGRALIKIYEEILSNGDKHADALKFFNSRYFSIAFPWGFNGQPLPGKKGPHWLDRYSAENLENESRRAVFEQVRTVLKKMMGSPYSHSFDYAVTYKEIVGIARSIFIMRIHAEKSSHRNYWNRGLAGFAFAQLIQNEQRLAMMKIVRLSKNPPRLERHGDDINERRAINMLSKMRQVGERWSKIERMLAKYMDGDVDESDIFKDILYLYTGKVYSGSYQWDESRPMSENEFGRWESYLERSAHSDGILNFLISQANNTSKIKEQLKGVSFIWDSLDPSRPFSDFRTKVLKTINTYERNRIESASEPPSSGARLSSEASAKEGLASEGKERRRVWTESIRSYAKGVVGKEASANLNSLKTHRDIISRTWLELSNQLHDEPIQIMGDDSYYGTPVLDKLILRVENLAQWEMEETKNFYFRLKSLRMETEGRLAISVLSRMRSTRERASRIITMLSKYGSALWDVDESQIFLDILSLYTDGVYPALRPTLPNAQPGDMDVEGKEKLAHFNDILEFLVQSAPNRRKLYDKLEALDKNIWASMDKSRPFETFKGYVVRAIEASPPIDSWSNSNWYDQAFNGFIIRVTETMAPVHERLNLKGSEKGLPTSWTEKIRSYAQALAGFGAIARLDTAATIQDIVRETEAVFAERLKEKTIQMHMSLNPDEAISKNISSLVRRESRLSLATLKRYSKFAVKLSTYGADIEGRISVKILDGVAATYQRSAWLLKTLNSYVGAEVSDARIFRDVINLYLYGVYPKVLKLSKIDAKARHKRRHEHFSNVIDIFLTGVSNPIDFFSQFEKINKSFFSKIDRERPINEFEGLVDRELSRKMSPSDEMSTQAGAPDRHAGARLAAADQKQSLEEIADDLLAIADEPGSRNDRYQLTMLAAQAHELAKANWDEKGIMDLAEAVRYQAHFLRFLNPGMSDRLQLIHLRILSAGSKDSSISIILTGTSLFLISIAVIAGILIGGAVLTYFLIREEIKIERLRNPGGKTVITQAGVKETAGTGEKGARLAETTLKLSPAHGQSLEEAVYGQWIRSVYLKKAIWKVKSSRWDINPANGSHFETLDVELSPRKNPTETIKLTLMMREPGVALWVYRNSNLESSGNKRELVEALEASIFQWMKNRGFNKVIFYDQRMFATGREVYLNMSDPPVESDAVRHSPVYEILGTQSRVAMAMARRFAELAKAHFEEFGSEEFNVRVIGEDIPVEFWRVISNKKFLDQIGPEAKQNIRVYVDKARFDTLSKRYRLLMPGLMDASIAGTEYIHLAFVGLGKKADGHLPEQVSQAENLVVVSVGVGKQYPIYRFFRKIRSELESESKKVHWILQASALAWERIKIKRDNGADVQVDIRRSANKEAPVLIALPGFMGVATFDRQAYDLGEEIEIASIPRPEHLPGHVKQRPREEYLKYLADDLAAVVRHYAKQNRKIFLISHSAGYDIEQSFYADKRFLDLHAFVHPLPPISPYTPETRYQMVLTMYDRLFGEEIKTSSWPLRVFYGVLITMLKNGPKFAKDWRNKTQENSQVPEPMSRLLFVMSTGLLFRLAARVFKPLWPSSQARRIQESRQVMSHAGVPEFLLGNIEAAFMKMSLSNLVRELNAILHYDSRIDRRAYYRKEELGVKRVLLVNPADAYVPASDNVRHATKYGGTAIELPAVPGEALGGHSPQITQAEVINDMIRSWIKQYENEVVLDLGRWRFVRLKEGEDNIGRYTKNAPLRYDAKGSLQGGVHFTQAESSRMADFDGNLLFISENTEITKRNVLQEILRAHAPPKEKSAFFSWTRISTHVQDPSNRPRVIRNPQTGNFETILYPHELKNLQKFGEPLMLSDGTLLTAGQLEAIDEVPTDILMMNSRLYRGYFKRAREMGAHHVHSAWQLVPDIDSAEAISNRSTYKEGLLFKLLTRLGLLEFHFKSVDSPKAAPVTTGVEEKRDVFRSYIEDARWLGGVLKDFAFRSGRDRRKAAESGIVLGKTSIFLYHILIRSVGMSSDKAAELGLDRLLWLWMQHVRVGDAVLDAFGNKLSAEQLRAIHQQLQRGQAELRFNDPTLEAEALRSLPAPTLASDDARNRLDIMNGYWDLQEELIGRMNLESAQKEQLRGILTKASAVLFHSYILEREAGTFPKIEQYNSVLDAKTEFQILLDLVDVFGTAENRSRKDALKKAFKEWLKIEQTVDDLLDMGDDLGNQPNIFLSTAKQFYPKEFGQLEKAVIENQDSGEPHRHVSVRKLAPETFRSVTRKSLSHLWTAREEFPISTWLFVAGNLLKYAKTVFSLTAERVEGENNSDAQSSAPTTFGPNEARAIVEELKRIQEQVQVREEEAGWAPIAIEYISKAIATLDTEYLNAETTGSAFSSVKVAFASISLSRDENLTGAVQNVMNRLNAVRKDTSGYALRSSQSEAGARLAHSPWIDQNEARSVVQQIERIQNYLYEITIKWDVALRPEEAQVWAGAWKNLEMAVERLSNPNVDAEAAYSALIELSDAERIAASRGDEYLRVELDVVTQRLFSLHKEAMEKIFPALLAEIDLIADELNRLADKETKDVIFSSWIPVVAEKIRRTKSYDHNALVEIINGLDAYVKVLRQDGSPMANPLQNITARYRALAFGGYSGPALRSSGEAGARLANANAPMTLEEAMVALDGFKGYPEINAAMAPAILKQLSKTSYTHDIGHISLGFGFMNLTAFNAKLPEELYHEIKNRHVELVMTVKAIRVLLTEHLDDLDQNQAIRVLAVIKEIADGESSRWALDVLGRDEFDALKNEDLFLSADYIIKDSSMEMASIFEKLKKWETEGISKIPEDIYQLVIEVARSRLWSEKNGYEWVDGHRYYLINNTKGIEIRITREPDYIQQDPDALENLIHVLETNAIQAAKSVGQRALVDFKVSSDKDAQDKEWVQMIFRDHGPGMTEEVLQNIRGVLAGGEGITTRREQGGSGLGLQSVYEDIVRDMDGNITVESSMDPSDPGTTFTIRVPMYHPSVLPAQSQADSSGARLAQKTNQRYSKTLARQEYQLITTDDVYNLGLGSLFSLMGDNVEHLDGNNEVFDLFKTAPPESRRILLAHLNRPASSGRGVLEKRKPLEELMAIENDKDKSIALMKKILSVTTEFSKTKVSFYKKLRDQHRKYQQEAFARGERSREPRHDREKIPAPETLYPSEAPGVIWVAKMLVMLGELQKMLPEKSGSWLGSTKLQMNRLMARPEFEIFYESSDFLEVVGKEANPYLFVPQEMLERAYYLRLGYMRKDYFMSHHHYEDLELLANANLDKDPETLRKSKEAAEYFEKLFDKSYTGKASPEEVRLDHALRYIRISGSLTQLKRALDLQSQLKRDGKWDVLNAQYTKLIGYFKEFWDPQKNSFVRNFPQGFMSGPIGRLDYFGRVALFSLKNDSHFASTDGVSEAEIELESYVNPFLKGTERKAKQTIIEPLSVHLTDKNNALLLSGPNMGGKTSTARSIGVAVLLNQMGWPTAAPKSKLGVFRRIFTVFPKPEQLQKGYGYFGGLIQQLTDLAKTAKKGDLIILDEVPTGTDYYDLVATTSVLLEDLIRSGATVIVTGHLKKAFEIVAEQTGIQPMQHSVKAIDGQVEPDFKLVPGIAKYSYAIELMAKAGFPKEVIEDARTYYQAIMEGSSGPTGARLASGEIGEAVNAMKMAQTVFGALYSQEHFAFKQTRGAVLMSFGDNALEPEQIDEHHQKTLLFTSFGREKLEELQRVIAKFESHNDQFGRPAQRNVNGLEYEKKITALSGFLDEVIGQLDVLGMDEYILGLKNRLSVSKDGLGQLRNDFKSPESDIFSVLLEIDKWSAIANVVLVNHLKPPKFTDEPHVFKLAESAPFFPDWDSAFLRNGVAQSLDIDREKPIAVLTAPNSSGKTVTMFNGFMNTLLAMNGYFVSGDFELSRFERVFSFFGSKDGVGQSYFMAILNHYAAILRNATPNSLVILDEMHGSDNFELAAIQLAVLRHLQKAGPIVIFNTHIRDGLKEASESIGLDLWTSMVEFDADTYTVKPKFKLERDPNLEAKSYGLAIAKQWLTPDQFRRAMDLYTELITSTAQPPSGARLSSVVSAQEAPTEVERQSLATTSKLKSVEQVAQELNDLLASYGGKLSGIDVHILNSDISQKEKDVWKRSMDDKQMNKSFLLDSEKIVYGFRTGIGFAGENIDEQIETITAFLKEAYPAHLFKTRIDLAKDRSGVYEIEVSKSPNPELQLVTGSRLAGSTSSPQEDAVVSSQVAVVREENAETDFFHGLALTLRSGFQGKFPLMEKDLSHVRIFSVTKDRRDMLVVVDKDTGRQYTYDVSIQSLTKLREDKKLDLSQAVDITEEALKLHEANGVPVATSAQPTAKVVLVDSFQDLPNNAFYQNLILRFSQTLSKGSQVILVSEEEGKAERIAAIAATLGVKNREQFVAMKKEGLPKRDSPTSYLLADSYLDKAKVLYGEDQKYFRLESPKEEGLIGVYAFAPIGALMDLVSLEDWGHAAELYSQVVGKNVNINELQAALRGALLIPFVSKFIGRLVAQMYMAERAFRSAA